MNQYLKYSGMVFQLLLLIAIGYWLGQWIGPKMGLSESNGSVVGLLVFLLVGMYRLIKDILADSK
ncbi:MAG TPA: hypothetical protein PKY12_12865, partial [Catalimonadaceae bacterium]|nr:hypothetical protein [Catalimonadaceae bacterium]